MPLCPACHRESPKPAGASIPYQWPHCQSLIVGHYCDLDLIGAGAMGDVYCARRPDMGDRTVAIKIPKAAEPQVCRRFEREIAASARLRHENIVCAFDRGEEEGRPYLVMEYVAGRPLADIVDAEHPLSPARVAGILQQVAAGLAHAATQRIVNRDIKPDNILIAFDNGVAKILDYGLGLIADLDGSAERVTRTGTLLGTPSFLAPEQARDPRGVTIAADVYALGCTAYYVLTRQTPFKAADSQGLLQQHAEAPRPSVRAIRPDVPAALDQLIQEMMAVDPHRRPSPKDLAKRLGQILPTLSDLRPPTASKTMVGMVDIACPGCGEVYHLRADTVGKPMTCRKNLCRQRFTIGPQVAMTQSMIPGQDDSPLLVAAEAVEAEAVETDAIEADAVEAEAIEAEAAEAVEACEAEVAEAAEAVEAVEAFEAVEAVEGEEVAHDEPEPEVLPLTAVVTVAAEVAEAAPADAPPVIETVNVTAAQIDTPVDEQVDVLPASAIVATTTSPSSASGGELPPLIGAAAAGAVPAPAVHGKTAAKTKPAGKPASRRQQRTRLMTMLVAASVLLLSGAGIGMMWYMYEPDTPAKQWQKVQDVYLERKWSRAEEQFEKFAAANPEDPHAKEVPYFLAMCKAGDDIFSDTGNVDRGLASAEEIFKQHRDTEVYNLYATDLHKALARLIERFSDQAVKVASPVKIEGARRAEVLLTTVAQAMQDDWVPDENARLAKLIKDSEQKVELAVARKEIVVALTQAQSPEPLPEIDQLYARIDQLLDAFPVHKADKEIVTLQGTSWRAEAARVRYVAFEPAEGEEPKALGLSDAGDGTQFVVWDGRQLPAAGEAGDRVVMALARGVLYVFDPQGNFLWARRLGVDTQRLPGRIEASATSPAALIAVSSEDNTLLAMEATTGRVLWRYPVGGDIVAPLTIVNIRGGPNTPDKKPGFLPTTNSDGAGGVIHVLELVLGKRMGHYDVGHPMSVGGTYDPSTGLVYFPAESKRVFAINPAAIDDPAASACRSVLFTGHASGALRSEPAVVGQYNRGQEYLIMPEASELEQMKLRAFELKDGGFADPRAAPLKESTLRGWSWFAPRSTPDRITLVTDDGDLGVFGLNLDNRDEALYRLVEDKSMYLQAGDRFRALAVHADEHLLWIMSGGVLRKFSLDLLKQRIRPIWPKEGQPAEVTGVPIHEAQMDRFGKTFYLATMSASGGRYDLTAVDSHSGQKLWQRQLGVNPAGDPLVESTDPARLLLVDQSGGVVDLDTALSAEAKTESPLAMQPSGIGALPAGADPRALLEIAQADGSRWLMVPLSGGNELALASLDGQQVGLQWQTLKLDSPLKGRPGLVAGPGRRAGAAAASPEEYLVVPCANGLLKRISPDPELATLVNEVSFPWSDTIPPSGVSTAEIYPLADGALLLVDSQRRVRRLEFRLEPVPTWEMAGSAFEPPSPLVHRPLIVNDQAYFLTADGVLHAIDAKNPSRELRSWSIAGRVSQPFLRGGQILAVVDQRTLVCINPVAAEVKEPKWQSAPTKGRIRGQPALAGDVLLVADDGRRITALRLDDGQPAWNKRIAVRAGPAAAAVPLGKDRLLVPLTDGTLWTLPLPEPAVAQKEAAP